MPVVEIDSLKAEGLRPYASLTEAQLRNKLEPNEGIFIAESPKVINVALEAGYEPLSLLTEREHLTGIAADIVDRIGDSVPVYVGERSLLAQLTGYELTRGVLCAMRRPKLPSMEQVCHEARRVAVVDNVSNSTNTGAIFRAAAALGIDGVLLSNTCCDPLNRRSVRVSMGTVMQVPWTYIPSWPECGVQELHKMGFEVAALALRPDAKPIDSPELKEAERLAIVMGSEGDGLPNATIDMCDHCVVIPMNCGVDSLNVAAAAAVAFWELRIKAKG